MLAPGGSRSQAQPMPAHAGGHSKSSQTAKQQVPSTRRAVRAGVRVGPLAVGTHHTEPRPDGTGRAADGQLPRVWSRASVPRLRLPLRGPGARDHVRSAARTIDTTGNEGIERPAKEWRSSLVCTLEYVKRGHSSISDHSALHNRGAESRYKAVISLYARSLTQEFCCPLSPMQSEPRVCPRWAVLLYAHRTPSPRAEIHFESSETLHSLARLTPAPGEPSLFLGAFSS